MATRAANVQAIETALGEPWSTIRARLEAAGGASASHKELAEALGPQFDGIVDRHEWWVQGAVVAYEQEIGRRVPGQRADGTFDVAVSRTLTGDRDEVIAGFAELIDDRPPQGLSPDAGVELTDRPRRSRTQKRSFWRADLEDGTRFEAAAEAKPAGPHRLQAARRRSGRGMESAPQGPHRSGEPDRFRSPCLSRPLNRR